MRVDVIDHLDGTIETGLIPVARLRERYDACPLGKAIVTKGIDRDESRSHSVFVTAVDTAQIPYPGRHRRRPTG